MGYVTWPRPFQGCYVIRRLGFAMFNPHIKFEMSTITCNEEMTGNAKWGLRSNAQGSSTVDGKRVVDFLLAIFELFSLALTAAALLSKICRNRRFSTGGESL